VAGGGVGLLAFGLDAGFLSPLWALFSFCSSPTAYAVGFIRTPLRGWARAALRGCVLTPLCGWRAGVPAPHGDS
jgi:hypothetical protein